MQAHSSRSEDWATSQKAGKVNLTFSVKKYYTVFVFNILAMVSQMLVEQSHRRRMVGSTCGSWGAGL
jgi:hypothetical protein